MIRRVPHYYKDFTCIASECKDNCCIGGWEIDIDDETAEYYLGIQGEFGDRLRASIDKTDEYCFKLKNGQCPFLDDHNLCEIYKHLGEDKMGVVCTQFPRYTEYYGSYKETGIGLACEEAERIIFSDKNAFELVSEEISEEIIKDEEYDEKLAEALFEVRDVLFKLMDIKDIPLYKKLTLLIWSGYTIQDAVNNNNYDFIKSLFLDDLNKLVESTVKVQTNLVDRDADSNDIASVNGIFNIICNGLADDNKNTNISKGIESIIYAYNELEILNDDWPDAIKHVLDVLHEDNMSNEEYVAVSREFMSYIDDKNRIFEYNNLIKYFIFRYFMKAAYDHDVFGKLQFAITNFCVIRDMDIVKWLDNNKSFSFQDRIDTVHIFSREVEYSEDNIEVLAEEFIFDDIFKGDNLIRLLLSL